VARRHHYSGTVTLKLMWALPVAGWWIPITLQIVLTIDLSNNNPFT